MQHITDYGRQGACTNGICTQQARRKVRRSSMDEQPLPFTKRGERRHVLNRDQAVDMIANHGTFYFEDSLIHDSTFMPKRSRWSDKFDGAVKSLSALHPELLANRAFKVCSLEVCERSQRAEKPSTAPATSFRLCCPQ
jgi:hypothetical protein